MAGGVTDGVADGVADGVGSDAGGARGRKIVGRGARENEGWHRHEVQGALCSGEEGEPLPVLPIVPGMGWWWVVRGGA